MQEVIVRPSIGSELLKEALRIPTKVDSAVHRTGDSQYADRKSRRTGNQVFGENLRNLSFSRRRGKVVMGVDRFQPVTKSPLLMILAWYWILLVYMTLPNHNKEEARES